MSLRRHLRGSRNHLRQLPRIPLLFAVFGYLAAETPSLLPRPWYFQGLIAGMSAVIFYGFGVVVRDLCLWSGLKVTVRPEARRPLTIIARVLVGLCLLVYPLAYLVWHFSVTNYVGAAGLDPLYPVLSTGTAITVMVLVIVLYRITSRAIRSVTARAEQRGPQKALPRFVATLVMLLVLAAVVDRLVVGGLVGVAQYQADEVNAATPQGLSSPVSSLRSGGPGSLLSWDSLGSDGRAFVSSGPTPAEISAATGGPAQEPIRVFVGTSSQRSLEQTRDLAVAEMDRTGAFDRQAVVVVTSTSTGFVNEWAAESVEYLLRGDTALVTMQYSTLPSAIALLTARDQPPLVGRLLFEAVADRVAARPADRRPKLYAMGESLGAYGGNGAFGSPQDMMARLDGALWTGTPSFTPIHAALTASRQLGSTTVNPVVDRGRHVRFASNAEELTADEYGHALGPWKSPRIVYLQHHTDPVVWWSTDLMFQTPAWLEETRPPGTPMSGMSWLPTITFWQITADMAMSNTVSGGFGHRYVESETVPAWAGILGMAPDGDYSTVQAAIKASRG
jgi:uncharacterized membrane protein